MAKQPVMFVENGTDDDAVCKVSGGPGGMGKDWKEWDLPSGERIEVPSIEGSLLHISIKINHPKEMRVTAAAIKDGLKLTKSKSKKRYEIKLNKNGRKENP